jgi:hypothetical protein
MTADEKQEFVLQGFVNPLGIVPAFVQPVFVSTGPGDGYYLQEVDAEGIIIGFCPGVEDDEIVVQHDERLTKAVGESALYAFALGGDKRILVDERGRLAERLKGNMHLFRQPALMLDLVEFCGEIALLPLARRRAYLGVEKAIGPQAAISWRNTQILLPLVRRQIQRILEADASVASYDTEVERIHLKGGSYSHATICMPDALHYVVSRIDPSFQRLVCDDLRKALDDFAVTSLNMIPESSMRNDLFAINERYARLWERDAGGLFEDAPSNDKLPAPGSAGDELPICPVCGDSMVAAEASAYLKADIIAYLWTCDTCGYGFLTKHRLSEEAVSASSAKSAPAKAPAANRKD